MLALQLTSDGMRLAEVPEPEPGPGEVLVEVTAAGLCHSDLTVAARRPDELGFALPVVLGHELAGTVAQVGAGVDGWQAGDAVAGYGPRGCGTCTGCVGGRVNYCRVGSDRRPPGLGADGALAQYVVVEAGSLVAADGVPALQAAALTDAGLTAHHAIARTGVGEGAVVVVIGVGGLGHAAVQLLRERGCRIVALDVEQAKLDLALRLGAEAALTSVRGVEGDIADLTHGEGVDAVLDFVASDATLGLAAGVLGRDGVLSIVGVGAGRLPVGMHAVALGTRVDTPFWGTREELVEVLDLCRSGRLTLEVESVGLEDVEAAYARLAAGQVLGRVAAVPRAGTAERR